MTGGYGVRFVRDEDGLLTGLAPVSTTSTVPTLTLSRSLDDGRVLASTLGPVTATYRRDIDVAQPGFGDFLGQTVTSKGAEVYRSNDGYDDGGRIVRWHDTAEGVSSDRTFDYDDAGRLVEVRETGSGTVLATYAYDANGNRTRVLDTCAGAECGECTERATPAAAGGDAEEAHAYAERTVCEPEAARRQHVRDDEEHRRRVRHERDAEHRGDDHDEAGGRRVSGGFHPATACRAVSNHDCACRRMDSTFALADAPSVGVRGA